MISLSSSLLTIDTNGHDFDFRGTLAAGGYAPFFTKKGAGTFYISVPADSTTSYYRVAQGDLVMQANARLKADPIEINSGGRFIVDNRIQVAARGTLNVNLGGGEYIIQGHASQPTVIQGRLGVTNDSNLETSFAPGYNILTLSAPSTASVTMDMSSLSVTIGSILLVRGDNLAGAANTTYTRLRATSVPTEKGGILPQIIIDTSSTGTGQTFGKYDTSSDAAGVIGLRALRPNEMTSTVLIQNPVYGGTTPTTANFLAAGNVSTIGDRSSIGTLTMAPGSHLSINSPKGLSLVQDVILLREGAVSEISGTTLPAASGTLSFVGGGDLRFGVTVDRDDVARHFGPGILEVTALQPRTEFVFTNGTLQVGPGNPMLRSDVSLQAAARLNLGNKSAELGNLTGMGTVVLGGGELTIGGRAGSERTFSGSLTGFGTFTSSVSEGMLLSGNSSFSGTLAAKEGTLNISGTLPNVSGVSLTDGNLSLDYTKVVNNQPRLAQVPVDVSSGSISLTAHPSLNTSVSLGALTADGLARISIDNSSTAAPPTEGLLTFASLQRRGRGAILFTPQTAAGRTARFDIASGLSGALVGDPATPTARPVLPYAMYNERPATFEPGVGLRALTASEQVSTITPGQNVRLTTDQTFTGTATINSFEVNSAIISGSSGTLQITSGFALVGGAIGVNLDFGSVEGHLFTKSVTQNAQVSGKISGTNGLTISGQYSLSLLGTNDFTGPLTINGARLNFSSLGVFGPDPSPIKLAGGALQYTGGTTTFTRDLDLHGAGGSFSSSSVNVTLASRITGPGDLSVAGTITLANSSNSYEGSTTFSGNLKFASDAVFGQSPSLRGLGSSATLTLQGNWTTSRELDVENSNITLETGGYNAVLNGALSGSSQFTKTGTGIVTINDASAFLGPIGVWGGTMRLNSNLGSSQLARLISVSAGARLEAQSSVPHEVNVAGTLAPGIGIGTLESGNLTFASGSRLELQLVNASEFDQLRVNGRVSFSGLVQLALDVPTGLGLTNSWPILLNDGGDAITTSSTAAFAINSTVLTEGRTFVLNGQTVQISYKAGDGNDIYILVPEPSTVALLAGAAFLLTNTRRKRKQSR